MISQLPKVYRHYIGVSSEDYTSVIAIKIGFCSEDYTSVIAIKIGFCSGEYTSVVAIPLVSVPTNM